MTSALKGPFDVVLFFFLYHPNGRTQKRSLEALKLIFELECNFLKALKIEILIKQADLPSFMTRMSSDSTKSVYGAIFNDQRQS